MKLNNRPLQDVNVRCKYETIGLCIMIWVFCFFSENQARAVLHSRYIILWLKATIQYNRFRQHTTYIHIAVCTIYHNILYIFCHTSHVILRLSSRLLQTGYNYFPVSVTSQFPESTWQDNFWTVSVRPFYWHELAMRWHVTHIIHP